MVKSIVALVTLIALGWAAWHVATGWHPPVRDYPLQGIDLPADPGPVEWGMVRARGADFAYLVATDGIRRAAGFEANWDALPDAGLRRGAVHLYSLCAPPEAQANAFNTFVPHTDDALPAAVDVTFRDDCPDRPDAATVTAGLRAFLTMAETHLGKPMLLRVAAPVEQEYHLSAAIPRPYWALRNLVAPTYPARRWRMWRASDFRRVEGIEGPVNWDVVAP